MDDKKIALYNKLVEKKFRVFNSLFTNLPYQSMQNIGMLLPFLRSESYEGLTNGLTPTQIINDFFDDHTDIIDEKERLNLLFTFIQYIERQVVMYDSVEEASFDVFYTSEDRGTIHHLETMSPSEEDMQSFFEKLNHFFVRLVFTAHPTQFYPSTVLRIIQSLREAIKQNDIEQVDVLLQQLGKTPFINSEKPTPVDEAKSIIYYLRFVYYQVIGDLYETVNESFYPDGNAPYQLFQLGFWPGGDRDGNPFVTTPTTLQVSNELRMTLIKCYYNHLKEIRRKLTFKGVIEPLNILSDRLYKNMFSPECDITAAEILSTLEEVKKVLVDKHNGLFINYLEGLIHRVKIFGLHFASLDIRQDSSVHKEVMQEIVAKYYDLDYAQMNEEERLDWIKNINKTINAIDFEDGIVHDTIRNIKQIKQIQEQNGLQGIHRYIISNSEDIFDVLNVYALFRLCGYAPEDIHIDIAPLFETIRGMDNAKATMKKLYELPLYAEHLKRRNMNQTIMLGFSDGTKDGGYLKANWEIYQTKERLTLVSEESGVHVHFFDGRGGPPARGGGNTHEFYAAQGNTIANNSLQLTIQGQTITSMYGNIPQAKYNFEQLFSAALINDLQHQNNDISPKHRELMEELANISYEAYSDLKAHELFVPYLEEMSTLKYYGKTNIGSRPSKRGGAQDKLDFSKLRAIPFVGSWSQLKQNVPGYFGVGTAIQQLIDEGREQEVKDLYEEVPFFKALLKNSMMAMEKTFFPLTYYMKDDPKFGGFWNILHDEYERSKALVLRISGADELLSGDPIRKLSIEHREQIVLPLLTIQQYALEQIQKRHPQKEIFEKMVTRTLFGNINASRNSA